jgi:hypothetical protein
MYAHQTEHGAASNLLHSFGVSRDRHRTGRNPDGVSREAGGSPPSLAF